MSRKTPSTFVGTQYYKLKYIIYLRLFMGYYKILIITPLNSLKCVFIHILSQAKENMTKGKRNSNIWRPEPSRPLPARKYGLRTSRINITKCSHPHFQKCIPSGLA